METGFNFDFSFLKTSIQIVTLSPYGIAFNAGAIKALGCPQYVRVGYDEKQHAIGVQANLSVRPGPIYKFASRVKNGWVRIGAKDFIRYISKTTRIDCDKKAVQFMANFDEVNQTLIIIIDEDHMIRK